MPARPRRPRPAALRRPLATALAVTLAAAGGVLAPAAASGAPTSAPPTWCASRLATLPGDSLSSANDVNDHGVVVGLSEPSPDRPRAVLWRRGRVSPLPGTTGRVSVALGVNNRGVVVGRLGGKAALWKKGRLVRLGTLPGGSRSTAEDVSDHGLVVGHSDNALGRTRPVVWWRGRIHELPILPQRFGGRATAVNEHGTVVGVAVKAQVWERGEGRELDPLPGNDVSEAIGVNDRGLVVGYSLLQGELWVPVAWRNDQPEALPVPGDFRYGWANDVNSFGLIAGWVQTGAGTRPVVWKHGRFVDLGPDTWTGLANAVNDRGRVVGYTTTDNRLRATIWKPCGRTE